MSLAGTGQDLTELIQMQEEIRFVLDALQIGIWKFNPTDQSLHWDESMYRLYDIKASDFAGHYQAWEGSLTEDARAEAVKALGEALSGKKEFDIVFEINTRGFGKRHIAGRGKVIRDSSGNPIMMYGINYDVTAQTKTENERERTAKFLDAVLNNVPSMIFVKDATADFRFSLLNLSGEKLLGLRSSDMLGKTDYDFFDKEQADFFRKCDLEVFENRKVLVVEKEELNGASGKRFLKTYKVPTFDQDGKPQMLIGISNDITEELQAKDALEQERVRSIQQTKLISLGQMSAGIAHEINNPLAIIQGYTSQFLEMDSAAPDLKKKYTSVYKAVERIAKIVKGLKKFSRSGATATFEVVNLCDVIDEAILLVGAKAKRHDTTIQFAPVCRPSISCNEVEIEQVMINLMGNAIDAVKDTSERWARVEVFEEVAGVVVRVLDSGAGIPEDARQRLFEPFFTTKPLGEGTGLGLSISKGILDDHKATISLVSGMKNTCFEIRFPKIATVKATAS